MSGLAVDAVIPVPPNDDPTDPDSAPWRLAAAFARRGASVRVLYPDHGDFGTSPFDALDTVRVPLVRPPPGALALERAFARNAAGLLRPDADAVLRCPVGLGSLSGTDSRHRRRELGFLWEDPALLVFDAAHRTGAVGPFRRLSGWLDRRALREQELAAIRGCVHLFADSDARLERLRKEYPAVRVESSLLPAGCESPVDVGGAESARSKLHLPLDVLVVGNLSSVRPEEAPAMDAVLGAFKRLRQLFPGARMVILGGGRKEPGVSYEAERTPHHVAEILRASDLLLLPRVVPGLDPAVLLALFYGKAVVVGPATTLPETPPKPVIRVAGDLDPATLASEVAELFADLDLRRLLEKRGREFAERFSMDECAQRVERLLLRAAEATLA